MFANISLIELSDVLLWTYTSITHSYTFLGLLAHRNLLKHLIHPPSAGNRCPVWCFVDLFLSLRLIFIFAFTTDSGFGVKDFQTNLGLRALFYLYWFLHLFVHLCTSAPNNQSYFASTFISSLTFSPTFVKAHFLSPVTGAFRYFAPMNYIVWSICPCRCACHWSSVRIYSTGGRLIRPRQD